MTVRPILTIGDERLRIRAEAVEMSPAAWREDALDLAETLADARRRLGFGRALAATQIGSRFRMIAFDCALGQFVALNPEISWASDERRLVWDDCFSVPDMCIGVSRHASISFRCRDVEGRDHGFDRLDFPLSELIQHEIDHLDGVLMVDRQISPDAVVAREMAEMVDVRMYGPSASGAARPMGQARQS